MRLHEIESFEATQKKSALATLLNMLKARADHAEQGLKISLNKLNTLLMNLGYSVTFDELVDYTKGNTMFDNLISDFNQEFITINTGFNIDNDSEAPEAGSEKTVKQMAKRATKRRK